MKWFNPDQWPAEVIEWLQLAAMIGIAMAVGWIVAYVVIRVAGRAAQRTATTVDETLIRCIRRPLLALGPLIAAQFVLTGVEADWPSRSLIQQILVLLLIATVAWLLIRCVNAVRGIVQGHYRMDVRDNLEARAINTKVAVLQKSAIVLIVILAAGAMLMTFPQLRQIGTSVLASAGLAGLVVGFAARPVLTNLIAGVQLALTQPIRLDDVVIVDGEWGRIEEILSTYVVVRLWDQRRLVVPLSYFVETPFQNWTRTSADIIGTAFIYVDYSVDVERVRQELHRILNDMSQWDGRAWALQVTDLTERTMQLRALMSAADAGMAFELRCTVRERLVEFIRREYPRGLPRVRADVHRRRQTPHRSRSIASQSNSES